MRQIFADEHYEELFRKHGYVVQPFLSGQETEELTSYYDQNKPDELPGDFHSTMFINDAEYRKKIDKALKNVTQSKVGDVLNDYKILFANYIVKEAAEHSDVGVHQDWSFMNEDEGTSVNIWFPLVDTDEVNGCLYIWPRSHQLSSKIRYTPYDAPEGEEVAVENAVPLRLKKGEAVIYHSGIFHFSGVNKSQQRRLAIGMVCIPSEVMPYHYFKTNENGQSKIEAYQVDTEFFYNYILDQRPTDYTKVKEHDVPARLNLREQHLAPSTLNEQAKIVGDYYDKWHKRFMDIYGGVIQALRPSGEQELLDYLQQSIGLRDGMKVLDAGSGVCTPAIYFAQNLNLSIDAITISEKQVQEGRRRIKEQDVANKVSCIHGDFHCLSELLPRNSYDAVLFLEALGHAARPDIVLQGASEVLKPGGFIYIKDFYPREADDEQLQKRIQKTVDNINREYCYNVLDLQMTLSTLRKQGMTISSIKPFEFESDISVREEFERRFGIEVFEGGEFVPAEWLEIRCHKTFEPNEARDA